MRTLMTSREFNQRTNAAKKASGEGPVIVTDRGEPKHVLLSYSDYVRLSGQGKSVAEYFASLPDTSDIDLPLERRVEMLRAAEFD
ncbi:MAG: type II toxin-antitoxin system prevent-host-death family antitoxin [Bifidobacteriaceae bacterium]|jgi:prevent-host-death family protein|nr:type II toxin-antitoxin system prevent-host-death family antitoxin [Bifidobacteriaceae bacterium]